jgi:Ca2+-binding EF-hand superfamily protein
VEWAESVFDEAEEAIFDAEDLDAIVYGVFGDCSNDCVESWAVAAAGEDADSFDSGCGDLVWHGWSLSAVWALWWFGVEKCNMWRVCSFGGVDTVSGTLMGGFTMKFVLIAGLGLMVSGAGAQFGPGGPGGAGGPEGFDGARGARGGPGGEMRERMHGRALKLFDADGDGELNEAERGEARAFAEARMAARKAKVLAEFDVDGDGVLSEVERKAVRETKRAEMEAKRAAMVKRFDVDVDGKLSDVERKAARETMRGEMEAKRAAVVEKYDADGNGRLGVEELGRAIDDGAMPFEGMRKGRGMKGGGPEGKHGRGGPRGRRGKPGLEN